jgi:hypothetical protein
MKNKLSVLLYFALLFILLSVVVITVKEDDLVSFKERLITIVYQLSFLSIILIIGYLKFKKKIKD